MRHQRLFLTMIRDLAVLALSRLHHSYRYDDDDYTSLHYKVHTCLLLVSLFVVAPPLPPIDTI